MLLPKLLLILSIIISKTNNINAYNSFNSNLYNDIEFLNELYNNYYNNYYTNNDNKDSILDYTLYFNDYIFDWSKQEDWDKINIINHKNRIKPYQEIEACTFPISSIQKRICINNKKTGGFKIKFKSNTPISSAKSLNYNNLYQNTQLDWDNKEDWNEISHLQNIIENTNNIASAHHNNYYNYYYSYDDDSPDFEDEPFTQEMADTLKSNDDEMFYGGAGGATKGIQQMQQQYVPRPQYPHGQYPHGQYPPGHHGGYDPQGYLQRYGPGMTQNGGMATMTGYPWPQTHPHIDPQVQQLIQKDPTLLQRNPQLLQQLQGQNGGDITALLEKLLRKDIAKNTHPSHRHKTCCRHRHGRTRRACCRHRSHNPHTINPMSFGKRGMIQYMMQENMANQEKDMINQQKHEGRKFMQENKYEFRNMENEMKFQDKRLEKLMEALKNKKGKGSKGADMVALVKAMRRRGNHGGANKLLAALMRRRRRRRRKKGGDSSYEKQYKDYLKKYKKYYKDWYKSYGTKNMGAQGMGMGMYAPMASMYGMGMPMMGMNGGYGMPMNGPNTITHVHIHHSVNGAHEEDDNILRAPGVVDLDDIGDGEGGMIEKCKPMQGVEICNKYDNKNDLVLTVRVGMDKKLRRDGDAADMGYDDYYDDDDMYDSDSDSEGFFNGRRLVDRYYDELDDDYDYGYEDEIYGRDFGDMFEYSLWKAEKIFDDVLYDTEYDFYDEYKHYLNRFNYDWHDNDVWDRKYYKKNTKCSHIIPGLFTRICLHYDKYDKNVKLHFDTASVNEINDMLDDKYNNKEGDIQTMHDMLEREYNDMKLYWNKDKDWNEIKTIYNHAQTYYDNDNKKNSHVIEKCKNMFVASICVNRNLNTRKIGLKVNIANGKSLLHASKAKEELNDYYRYLYDSVYDRVRQQQLRAAQI